MRPDVQHSALPCQEEVADIRAGLEAKQVANSNTDPNPKPDTH